MKTETIFNSVSPTGDVFEASLHPEAEAARLTTFVEESNRPVVVVQGLGFVGSAMMAALANTRRSGDEPMYSVVGVDLGDERNYWKIARINQGLSPISSTDAAIEAAYAWSFQKGNSTATFSPAAYAHADIVVVDIHLDILKTEAAPGYTFSYDAYLKAIETVARHMKEDTLVIIETTVPPGTTEHKVLPLMQDIFKARGFDPGAVQLAHSYERVMPGRNYLKSITDYFRVFSAISERSREKARAFFESFINTEDFPLSELHRPNASEMAKVLENSYRAANIALIQEWTEFAEGAGVNLFEVLTAIRQRPTHQNIMYPGFGVGGYCLTKDSLLADWSHTQLFGSESHLDMSREAIRINDAMPRHTFRLLKRYVDLKQKPVVTVLGVSYLNDVADTRYSPSEIFVDFCELAGCKVQLHDPLVPYWEEKGIEVATSFDAMQALSHEVLVFTVRHREYIELTASALLATFPGVRIVIDANNVIGNGVYRELLNNGITVLGVGKGHWNAVVAPLMENKK